MVIDTFPLEESIFSSTSDMHITYEDTNVVQYIAGYVCWKVQMKIEKSYHTNKVALPECLESNFSDEEKEIATASADWVDVVDRGGLVHVKDTYTFYSVLWKMKYGSNFNLRRMRRMIIVIVWSVYLCVSVCVSVCLCVTTNLGIYANRCQMMSTNGISGVW